MTGKNGTVRDGVDDRLGQADESWQRWARISNTWAFDILVRVVYIAWFLFVLSSLWTNLNGDIAAYGLNPGIPLFTSILSRLAVILFLATLVALVAVRRKPVRKSRGFQPRLVAFLGTFILMSFPLFPAREMALPGLMISTALVLVGNGLSIYTAFALGRSVSIMPEARRLVTSGAYRFVRHPLYVAEEIAIVGTFLLYASPGALVLLVVHGVLQLRRMGYEEKVLTQTFPEYGDYARQTARVIPGLY